MHVGACVCVCVCVALIMNCSASPYWKQSKLVNIDAMEEDDVRFECQVSGIPKPVITWTVNGVPVDGRVSFSGQAFRRMIRYTSAERLIA